MDNIEFDVQVLGFEGQGLNRLQVVLDGEGCLPRLWTLEPGVASESIS